MVLNHPHQTVRFDTAQAGVGKIYDVINNALLVSESTAPRLNQLFLDRVSGNGVTVRSIIEDVSLNIGFVVADDIDATELTDVIPGYIVSSRMQASAALRPLSEMFFFDIVESDFKVKFPRRDNAFSMIARSSGDRDVICFGPVDTARRCYVAISTCSVAPASQSNETA